MGGHVDTVKNNDVEKEVGAMKRLVILGEGYGRTLKEVA